MNAFRVEIHNPTKTSPSKGFVRIVWSSLELRRPDEPRSYSDEGYEDISLQDAPDIVAALLRRGHTEAARTVCDAWYVSLAQMAGNKAVVLSR